MLSFRPSLLIESFRLDTGLSAGELIRARLLLEAKRLLLHSEQTVAEIGYELGFEDPSYFSRFVRREIETSPLELRKPASRKVPEIHGIVPGWVFGSLLQLRNLIP